MRAILVALLCALAGVALPASAGAQTPARDVLFVGNSNDGTIDLFDAHTLTRIGGFSAIPDGNIPQDPLQAALYEPLTSKVGINYVQDLALSPDRKTLYVSRGYLGDVAAFDLSQGGKLLWRVQTHSLRADHAELSPDGRRLFVSALTADTVEVVDTATHQIVAEIPAGDWPHTLGFSPDGKTVWSGSLGVQIADTATSTTPPTDGRHWLEAIDPSTMLPTGTPCELGVGIRPFVLTPDGSRMYVQLSYYNGIVEYDPWHCRTLRTLDLPFAGRGLTTQPHDYPNLAAQHGVAISPDGSLLCLAGTIDDDVELVSLPSFTLSKTIPVGQDPGWAVNSPDGRYCFVSSRADPGANSVAVVSYATQSVVATLATGHHPQAEITGRVPDRALEAGGFR
jgi:YVTN family beta-propeller protein